MQNDQTTVTTTDNEIELDDLLLSEAQEADIRAGFDLTGTPQPPRPCLGCTWGPPLTNHNETVAEDDEIELDDLLLTEVQENDIKAGCLGCNWGPPMTNHNETVAEDDVTEAEALADLPLTAAQAEATKAGDGGGLLRHSSGALRNVTSSNI